MDFYKIKERTARNGVIEIYPDFIVGRSKDLMVRGKSFYAIWDAKAGLWTTDEYDVQRLVDEDLYAYRDSIAEKRAGILQVKLMSDFSSGSWVQFRKYLNHVSDSAHQLDTTLTFSNTDVKKTDYVSRRLPYPLEEGECEAYEELISTLYDPEERAKLEWAIGAIVAGEAKDIQKFVVLYGEAGAGKSTFLNIVQKLFEGYYTTFEAKALTSNNNAFSTEIFRSNPLVAIQHDGDLSRIEDNTKLNSIISHEEITMNEKFKPSYTSRINAFLFMGTNRPVKITDAKSGIIRRLIDVKPSGRRVPPKRYHTLVSQIDFELGAIAHHCKQVYLEMGRSFYSSYRPVEMILHTDVFYNFIENAYFQFKADDGVTLNRAYEMYKEYCEDSLVDFKLPKYKFREELKNYFREFLERTRLESGEQVRSYYAGFLDEKFTTTVTVDEPPYSMVIDRKNSLIDVIFADRPAQYANERETPRQKWSEVTTVLKDLDTSELHYVKPPSNHIVIDFDLKGEDGDKSLELNLQAASKWPPTYAEFSKGGNGIHLHYEYDGNVSELSRVYEDGIEVKVFTGNSSLRRRLTLCNDIPVATINSGLPLKEKKVINQDTVKSEKGLRDLITRNLKKEIHPATKPSIDFIHKILQDAYESGMSYDVTDMMGPILAFANGSSNQALTCLKIVKSMKFKSEEMEKSKEAFEVSDEVTFFDVEVFPNLFIICWKDIGPDKKTVRMINPSAQEVEFLLEKKLVGFANRRYDNHILYARYMGYSNEDLYNLSQRIIKNDPTAMFGEAYNLSYADIYDFSSKKQSLKKFQHDLGIRHMEFGHPWDQPVPEELVLKAAEYCENDVLATEEVWNDRKGDFTARRILAELSGLTVNDTTQKHTAKIIFEGNRKASEHFVYTDLSEMFPGYEYEFGTSTYRGEKVGEGGYVYAEPGMYSDVYVLDIASMHPTSIVRLGLFGEKYTKNFEDLLKARLAIKHGEYDQAKKMLGGRLAPYLQDETGAKELSYALKIVINIVYGLTSAKFDNPFRDIRNKDNIVAKRGALFMVDLKNHVQAQGFQVVHIKTDSIKIPGATPEIIKSVIEFGKKYGYDFEHEATYEKFCLVNDAVYIAKDERGWEAVGAQFQHPYVYKTLFSKQPIETRDMSEMKSVTTALYLDMNEDLPEDEHNYRFVGKTGVFYPIKPGKGGGILCREKDGAYHAASGTKGYRWLERETVESLNLEKAIDDSYFKRLVDQAVSKISEFGDFEWLVD